MGSKHKHKDKDKDKKRRTKEKKAKKEKRGKHHKRRHGPASGSGSDEDGPAITVSQQLAMGRAAARATREILAYKYELRKDLREVGANPAPIRTARPPACRNTAGNLDAWGG